MIALIGITAYLVYFSATQYSSCLATDKAEQTANGEEKEVKPPNAYEKTVNGSLGANISSLAEFERRYGKEQSGRSSSSSSRLRSRKSKSGGGGGDNHLQVTLYFLGDALKNKAKDFAGGLLRSTTLWLVMTVASSVLLLFLLCGAALLSDRINLAIRLIEETSTALAALRLLVVLFLPLVPYLFQLTATALWVAISLSLFAARRPTYLNERFVECVPSFAGDEVAAAGGGGNQSAVVDKDGSCQLRSPLSGPSLLLCQLFSFFCYQWLFYFLEALCK